MQHLHNGMHQMQECFRSPNLSPPPSSRKRSPAAILHSSVIEYLPNTFATVAASDDRHNSAHRRKTKVSPHRRFC